MYSIVKDGKTITLVPLSPTQVYEYQMKLKKRKVKLRGKKIQVRNMVREDN
jgi:hypothetical protein